ncbi:uncharacterized protein LOC135398901 isoform X2 [Ornithodoros turicata]|uniref:uncharacterized protein LOC135398901 isoform X2 n=1 Tax=Ornithodoros turicata TaxID=34597 RepID=UPI0031394398
MGVPRNSLGTDQETEKWDATERALLSNMMVYNETKNNDVDKETSTGSEGHTSLKQSLKECLECYKITNAVWCTTEADKFYQVCFPCEPGALTDSILHDLTTRGIGSKYDSSVGVMPCPIFFKRMENDDAETISQREEKAAEDVDSKEEQKHSTFRSMHRKFFKSVTARLTVAQVVSGVRAQGEMTFDYVAFVILAGMIAALGLMDNNVVSIIAAMLVSPLMGPIMAITFGIIIQDKTLTKVGLKTELIGLFICLLFGFCFGLLNAFWGDIPPYEGTSWSPSRWPNSEMSSRGHWRSLWVGALVALPSGGGVAMAILGGNSACLVGVAISASLLPPIINTGLLWSLSLVKVFKSLTQENILINATGTVISVPQAFVAPANFQPYYFDRYSMHKECAMLGAVSFSLTVVNIICIIIAGTVVLKIKEVAPAASLPSTRRFWKHDIKVARDYNKSLDGITGMRLLEEWAQMEGASDDDPSKKENRLQDIQDMIEEAEEDDVYKTVKQYVANQPPVNFVKHLARQLSVPEGKAKYAGRMNVWELEHLLDESAAVDAKRARQARVSFKFGRSLSQEASYKEMDDPGSPDSEKKEHSRPRRFFRLRPSSRFQVTKVRDS